MYQFLGGFLAATILLSLAACGGSSPKGVTQSNLPGQVSTASTGAGVSHYAASRFLEQASMGPTVASVARVRQVGMSAWIDEQLKKPVSKITTPAEFINFDGNDSAAFQRADLFHFNTLHDLAVGADDQLRFRTAWVLSNLLVISTAKVDKFGANEYWNLLMAGAFGNYGDLLKAVTLHAAMGLYLDNHQNRKGGLNENYGRELMQLFSVGLVLLNPDGSAKRDASGMPLETYTQRDVIEMTRALTGWAFSPNPANDRVMNNANYKSYEKPMVVRDPQQHDTDAKEVLGKTIPAGGDAARDLDAVVNILMTHPNTAPFVSIRLIQGLTASDPSPAYIKRVATVFQQTGGNLASVIKAILSDPESRQGDSAGNAASGFGRIREPFLQHIAVTRALGCQRAMRYHSSERVMTTKQLPLGAPTVFNFYPPNHRAPGSNLLAPEQKTLHATEFDHRLFRYNNYSWDGESALLNAGCDLALFKTALAQSDDAAIDLLEERLFRGAMPGPVRAAMKEALESKPWARNNPIQFLQGMVQVATLAVGVGASK